jgi:hypothetical protein
MCLGKWHTLRAARLPAHHPMAASPAVPLQCAVAIHLRPRALFPWAGPKAVLVLVVCPATAPGGVPILVCCAFSFTRQRASQGGCLCQTLCLRLMLETGVVFCTLAGAATPVLSERLALRK